MYLSLQEVLRPTALQACLDLLDQQDTVPLGGGTWLNAGGHEDVVRLVDLQALPLRDLKVEAAQLRLGALVRLSELVGGALPAGATALEQAATAEHNLAIRNQSTVGGRVARHTADGRLATALLALGAELELAQTPQRLPLSEALGRPDALRALITAVVIPELPLDSTYVWFGRTAVDAPMADAAAARMGDGSFRLSSGGHGADARGVVHLTEAAKLAGAIAPDTPIGSWWPGLHAAALAALPAYGDLRASGDWRRDVGATLVCRAVQALIERGGAA